MSLGDSDTEIWVGSDGNFYVVNDYGEIFLLDAEGNQVPVPEDFDRTIVFGTDPEPQWKPKPGSFIPPRTAPEHAWVTDRSEEHIRKYFSGDFSNETIQRALITIDVIGRWHTNIKVMIEILNYYHISIQSALNITYGYDVDATYPDKLVVMSPDNIFYPKNIVQRMIYFMEETLRVLDVDTTDLVLPKTTEYLHFSQVNAFEEALKRICIKLNSFNDTTQTMYCGKLISGGIITQ